MQSLQLSVVVPRYPAVHRVLECPFTGHISYAWRSLLLLQCTSMLGLPSVMPTLPFALPTIEPTADFYGLV